MQRKPADDHPETLLGVNTDRYFEGSQDAPPRVINQPPTWVEESALAELFQPFVNMGPVR